MIVVVQIEAGREEDREDEGGDDDDARRGRSAGEDERGWALSFEC